MLRMPSPSTTADAPSPSAAVATAAPSTSSSKAFMSTYYAALEFVATRTVHIVQKPLPSVPAGGVAIRALASMISSGTEMLIYRGLWDESDEPLDKTIKGLSDSSLKYPMAYGYSLVGRIERVGEGVPSRMIGTTVFAFAPHAECAFADAEGIQHVPPNLSPLDATFLPAAETAISIVRRASKSRGDSSRVWLRCYRPASHLLPVPSRPGCVCGGTRCIAS